MSNSTTLSFKIDKTIKAKAQDTAAVMGVPLTTVITIFLKDFATTGRLEVTAADDMTVQMERIIETFRSEVKSGQLSPKFTDIKKAEKYLMSL
jgi:addiction module RelB/DinJ family antitoxin